MKKKELLKHIPENPEDPFIRRIRTPDGIALMTVLFRIPAGYISLGKTGT